MSNGMEREKNELTRKEIETEEMKRKLMVMGIYERGFTYDYMKDLIGFLAEPSKDTSSVTTNKRNTLHKGNAQHSDNESELTSETDNSQEQTVVQEQAVVQEHIETPIPTYSYKTSRTSPTVHEHKTICYSSSPDCFSMFDEQASSYRVKSLDSNEMSERQHENANCANRFVSLRSGSVTRDGLNTTETGATTSSSGQSEHNQKLDKWRLNPLDICIDENDVPLPQLSRSSVRERAPFADCKEARTSEQRDQVARALRQHLREMADLWYRWRPSTDSKFEWGSPIQVSTINSSLDRTPLNPKTEPIKMECTYRDNCERASKRKACSLITNLSRNSSSEDEDDCVRVKKKKTDGKSGNMDRITRRMRAIKHEKTSNATAHQQLPSNVDNDDNDDTITNMNLDEIEDNRSLCFEKESDEVSERLSPEIITYPKKIVPLNPKARLSLNRQRISGNLMSKPDQKMQYIIGNEDVERVRERKKDDKLTDEEIYRKLEEISNEEKKEEEEEEEEREGEKAIVTVKKNMKIRSLPKETRSRLQEKRSNNMEIGIKKTRAKLKEKELDIRKRKQQNKEKKMEFDEVELFSQKEEKLYQKENTNASWEHLLLSNDETESTEMNRESDVQNGNRCDNASITGQISCPICNKLFPHDEIENHAADCDQFEINNSADQLECNICSNYKTKNGIEYEKHVQRCIKIKNDKIHLQYIEFEDDNVISDQKSSEIDYEDQSPSYSRIKASTGRKRKH